MNRRLAAGTVNAALTGDVEGAHNTTGDGGGTLKMTTRISDVL